MLSCRDVTRRIASDDWVQAGFMGRVGLRLHLMMCRHCRAYARQLRAIAEAARTAWQPRPRDQQVLDRLQERILQQVESEERTSPSDRQPESQ